MNVSILGPILGVAIWYDNKIYTLPAPNRHHDVIRDIASKNGVGIAGEDRQGFYSENMAFMDRETAMVVALACGQLLNPANISSSNQLFSEDMW